MQEKTVKNGGAPHWNLDPIYAGFDSPRYLDDKKRLETGTAELVRLAARGPEKGQNPGEWIASFIMSMNKAGDLLENLMSYAYTKFTTCTTDGQALKELAAMEEMAIPMKDAEVAFRNALAELGKTAADLAALRPDLASYRFFLEEELFLQKKQMTPAEENLAADLTRCGGDAWGRMQEAVSAILQADWDTTTGERKTVTQLRALAFDRDRAVRRKAYRLELEAWKTAETPLSYALNGVKGFSVILNKRRNFKSTLERSTIQARLTPKALESMIGAMEEFLPAFRGYLKTKAKILGIPVCAFYDLFAPVGKNPRQWDFAEARDFIVEQFGGFSAELANFASTAFNNGWIDAEPREGKVGGAYCISFPINEESRILCNFGGAFGDVSTIAHELGHGYHHEVLKKESAIHRNYPMTLAETASIFCESVILHGALKRMGTEERITALESFLQDATQVIVDILSRYYFENELCDRREKSELSPDELSDMMIKAQKATYGDALDPDQLHKYMWAVKSHYYRTDLAFYNFPYAFGQLFGLGLFSRFQTEGASFVPKYNALLRETGRANAADLAKTAGFDIEGKEFWREGLKAIEGRIDQLRSLVEKG